ncbi:hypothetical protein HK098_001577 [Nowakowskiella sp. JEL0407]|nr:hypothetical protein HK098_001577 [Nowakowskiella sp. JEL0407]
MNDETLTRHYQSLPETDKAIIDIIKCYEGDETVIDSESSSSADYITPDLQSLPRNAVPKTYRPAYGNFSHLRFTKQRTSLDDRESVKYNHHQQTNKFERRDSDQHNNRREHSRVFELDPNIRDYDPSNASVRPRYEDECNNAFFSGIENLSLDFSNICVGGSDLYSDTGANLGEFSATSAHSQEITRRRPVFPSRSSSLTQGVEINKSWDHIIIETKGSVEQRIAEFTNSHMETCESQIFSSSQSTAGSSNSQFDFKQRILDAFHKLYDRRTQFRSRRQEIRIIRLKHSSYTPECSTPVPVSSSWGINLTPVTPKSSIDTEATDKPTYANPNSGANSKFMSKRRKCIAFLKELFT